MSYRCKYGLYHHKPVTNDMPSSNNGWIYTAYAKRLGLKVPSADDLGILAIKSMNNTQEGFWTNRLPDMQDPVISHDEILGMLSLGVISDRHLELRNWSMTTVSDSKYSIIEQIKGLWSLRGQHRTYVHRHPVEAAYPIVFKLGPHIRYYAKKLNGKRPSILEWAAFNAGIFLDLVQPSAWASTHNLSTLMLEDLESKFWIKFYNKKKNYDDYFQDGHVFREKLNE